MQRIKFNSFIIIYLTLFMLLAITAPVSAQDYLVERVRSIITQQYVEQVPPAVASANSIDTMLKALGDPYAQYFTRDEFDQFKAALDQTFVGIGIVFDLDPQGAVIKSVISQSPAEQSGLLAGDIIISVDGTGLSGKDIAAIGKLIRGQENTSVQLHIKRQNKTMTKMVTRHSIDVPSVSGRLLPNRIGYINISAFSSDTGDKFGEIAASLQKQGAKSWILDMQDNGGGYLEAARRVAGYFIAGKTCLLCDNRFTNSRPLEAEASTLQLNGPIVILVNEQTASASEVLTGALQDYGRAIVIGNRTFGKGCVQWLFNLGEDGVFKLTCEKYRTPLGHEVNKVGIVPDLSPAGDRMKMAELILSGQSMTSKQKKTVAIVKGKIYPINLTMANSTAYKSTYTELLHLIAPAGKIAGSKQ